MQRHLPKLPARRHVHKNQSCRNSHCSRIISEARLAVTGANEVHRALCTPESQRLGGYEVGARILPARYVSGDFVCSLPYRHGTFLVLGDLMGKGLSAAMWITHVVDLLHRAAEHADGVGELLGSLNMEILKSRISAPLASAIAISIDKYDGSLTCALAGHPPSVVLRNNGHAETIMAGGPLMGVCSGATYDSETISLEGGESMIAFSDGLSDALFSDRLPVENIVAAIAGNAGPTPSDKISRLVDASNALATDVAIDDLSIMVVQRS